MPLEAYSLSDIGKVRSINQDCVYVTCDQIGNLENLFIVADGMGGHQAGDYASAYTVRRMQELARQEDYQDPAEFFTKAAKIINREVYDLGRTNIQLQGMGTTLVACTLDHNRVMTAVNIGDSRLYVYHYDTGIRQVTRDHSYVEELVRRGQISRDSSLYRSAKNVITRAIGMPGVVEPDIFTLELNTEDQLLLCSDGLTNEVPDSLIALMMAMEESPEEKAKNLVWEANRSGGQDNISVIVIAQNGTCAG